MNHRNANFTRSLIATAVGALLAATAQAQNAAPKRSSAALLEEVVVTARKREEGAQDVPVAISAFNSDQIDALKVRNLTNLAVGMPSVVLDEIGTSRGYANFSIRGLGVNSSIPSIDPAVGIVLDGVYLGTNAGVVFDTFDLESIEVLRGPQGTLFGRNVTGGAVLINTKKPTQEFSVSAKAAYDQAVEGTGGGNVYLQGSVSGGVTDTLAAKLAVYYNDDEGALDITDGPLAGQSHGGQEQTIIRPAISWTPNDDFDLTVRYEYQDVEADGPSAQKHTNGSGVPGAINNYSRDDFGFAIDEPGSFELEVNFLNIQANWNVAGGTLTNVFGLRESESFTNADIDASEVWVFHSDTASTYDQWSNELRWNGRTMDDKANVTVGAYVFESELAYDEDRNLLGVLTGNVRPAVTQNGGGLLDVSSLGLFAAVDYDLTDDLQLTAGLRWSREEKEAQIVTLTKAPNFGSECKVGGLVNISYVGADVERDCEADFVDDKTWSFVSPKLGLMYQLSDSSRMYANWSRGYRSGGYNLRNTEFPVVYGPGPFDEEQADSIEIGYKAEWDGGQLNFAMYRTEMSDMQREVNLPSPTAGVLQLIQNTADAEIVGFEVDGTFRITDAFTLKASMGWLSANYTKVAFDLNGDGVVDGKDEDLSLPRAPDLTYSLTGIYDVDLGAHGYVSALAMYGYRDETAYTDNNLGYINEQDQLDVAIDWHMGNGNWVISLYGRNLMDSVRHGGDTQLSALLAGYPTGGTFSPLNKPATWGMEVSYSM